MKTCFKWMAYNALKCALMYSLYIHIPFCAIHCTYCAFNIYTRAEALIPTYVEAVRADLRALGKAASGQRVPLHTIYLGGGTPSLLTPAQIGAILTTCRETFEVLPDAEISMEVNPTAADVAYFEAVREMSVNRLSIGMQSAQPDELRLMLRDHAPDAAPRVVDAARRAGFTNLNLDLIFGLPDQTMDSWMRTVCAALALQPDHLSMYSLELEPNTAMTVKIERGKLAEPDDDLTADMYEAADELVTEAGFAQYEISNWARPGFECLHNMQYWRYLPYLGVGAGAHGFVEGIRYEVVKRPRAYIARALSPHPPTLFPLTATVESYLAVDTSEAMAEYVFTGLRMVRAGISATAFYRRFGRPIDMVYGRQIARLVGEGLLSREGDIIRLSRSARMISNRVSSAFI
jgi:oxygen-independent coproporphyrinogen-3 oxidase